LGWDRIYLSTQRERPFHEAFKAAPSNLVVLHRDGPVKVRRSTRGLMHARTVPMGGLFLHPSGTDLEVGLDGSVHTIHIYMSEAALQEATGDNAVQLREEMGSTDHFLEQMILALDEAVQTWEPCARTYTDHIAILIALRLAGFHSHPTQKGALRSSGLSDRQMEVIRELIDARISEPIPLNDLALAVSLSVSQFARNFKARTGMPPHRYLMRVRVNRAVKLLQSGDTPIAEVATLCGFSHQEHLTRVMRANLGVTPGTVRRQGAVYRRLQSPVDS
jgi:AraC family transcriptional regulator